MELKGGVAIVTGGGTGIGRATCEALVARGVNGVAVNYSRSQNEAETTAALLREAGADAVAVAADVADEESTSRMLREVIQRWGRLDVLINNAGTTEFIPFSDLDAATDEVWDRLLAVNVKGTFRCTRLAAPHLRKARGAVINVGSIAGLRATGSSLPYGVSKAAIHQLTRGLAVALAPEVRVNAIAPGLVATDWFRRRFGDDTAREMEVAESQRTPLAGVASARDCAAVIMGLLESDWVTGQVVVVDGGKHLTY